MLTRFAGIVFLAVICLGLHTACNAAEEIAIGSQGPDFHAVGVDGKEYSLASTKGAKVTVLCFTCNRCPVAVDYQDRFVDFVKEYRDKDVKFIALNCNNATENLEAMKRRAEEKDFNFVYAFDKTAQAATAYGARCTPHLFVLDGEGKVAYRGAFDDSRKNPKVSYVADAVDAVLAGKTPETTSTQAFGCGIKAKR